VDFFNAKITLSVLVRLRYHLEKVNLIDVGACNAKITWSMECFGKVKRLLGKG